MMYLYQINDYSNFLSSTQKDNQVAVFFFVSEYIPIFLGSINCVFFDFKKIYWVSQFN